MSFVYNEFKRMLAAGEVDWDSNDIRVALLLNTTTADTEDDVNNLAAFTTLGEVTDGSYARQAIGTEAINEDAANNRAELDGDNVAWSALTTGGTVQGALVYQHVGADAVNKPIAFIDSGGFPFSLTGADLTINWNAEGIVQIT